MDIEREGCGGTCLAIHLHPLIQALAVDGERVDENLIRGECKRLYGKFHTGVQHFLDPSCDFSIPIRSKGYNNTKPAKCIFVCCKDVEIKVVEEIKSSKSIILL